MANIKSLVTGLMLSLNKVEKEGLSILLGGEEEKFNHETRVTQQSIKVLSSRRFYDLVHKADEIDRRRHQSKLQLLSEKRGISGDIIHTFKNVRYTGMFDGPSHSDSTAEFSFKTSNKISRFANSAYVVKNGELYDLHITIGLLNEQQSLRHTDFSDLKYFGVKEKGKTYLYGIIQHDGTKIIGADMDITFQVFVIKDGELSSRINDNESIMTKDDLIDPRTFMYPTGGE